MDLEHPRSVAVELQGPESPQELDFQRLAERAAVAAEEAAPGLAALMAADIEGLAGQSDTGPVVAERRLSGRILLVEAASQHPEHQQNTLAADTFLDSFLKERPLPIRAYRGRSGSTWLSQG